MAIPDRSERAFSDDTNARSAARETQGRAIVGVRLEGGIGDHLLGMRVLRFVHRRYPNADIVVYSDAAGHRTQQQTARLSPLVSRVIPVMQQLERVRSPRDMGRLEHLPEECLRLMTSADVFIDTFGETLLAPASATLNVPLFEMLAERPTLVVPHDGDEAAAELLKAYRHSAIVGLNLTKYGVDLLRQHEATIRDFIEALLRDPNVIILNMWTSTYDFPHWPEPVRSTRERQSRELGSFLMNLCSWDPRIVACVDLPLLTIAGLLKRCGYFVGVDNGIKHLAWALGIPHTFFYPGQPTLHAVLRWMPDVHRLLRFDCSRTEVLSHIEAARGALRTAPMRQRNA